MLSAALVMAAMEPSHRWTFYKHYTLKTHSREYVWHKQTACNIRAEFRTDWSREMIRVDMIEYIARQYWPMELVKPFLEEGWPRWVANPPGWFDAIFKARIPLALIPAVASHGAETA